MMADRRANRQTKETVTDQKMPNQRNAAAYSQRDYTAVLGCEDPGTKAIELLTTEGALVKFYLDLSKTQCISEPIVRYFALALLARLKLDLRLRSKYLDRVFADAFVNSSAVNMIFEFLPFALKERFMSNSPFAGFGQYLARDLSRKENDKTLSILGSTSSYENLEYQMKVVSLQSALEILVDDEHSTINNQLQTRKLPAYTQERCDQRTENLIVRLSDYFALNDYGDLHYHQLAILQECLAYAKRFYRHRWRVEVEDVLEAWFFVKYFKRPRRPLSKSSKKILDFIYAQNRERNFPSQRHIIKKTGLATKVVSQAVGLKIKAWEGAGRHIADGSVMYDEDKHGYALTPAGELALTDDFHITLDGEVYRPKHPLE